MDRELLRNKLRYFKEVKGVNFNYWSKRTNTNRCTISNFMSGTRGISDDLACRLWNEIQNY